MNEKIRKSEMKWVVKDGTNSTNASAVCDTKGDAVNAAKEAAKNEPGKPFFVYEVVDAYRAESPVAKKQEIETKKPAE